MTTRSLEDIISYEQQALDLLDESHPHYDEIKSLLTDQIMDDIDDCKHPTDRRTTQTRKRSD